MSTIEIMFNGIDSIDVDPKPAEEILLERTGPGAEFTGWVDLPVEYDRDEFERIKNAAAKIRSDSDVLIVCGIGGSYLGAAAALDFLKGAMNNLKIRGALKTLSDQEGYETFVVPDEVGGRFSVLTAVGLLPIAAAGCDIDALMEGAASMREEVMTQSDELNEALCYAALRQQLYDWDRCIEIFVNYDPDLRLFGEWLKQLFGEREGKENLSISVL